MKILPYILFYALWCILSRTFLVLLVCNVSTILLYCHSNICFRRVNICQLDVCTKMNISISWYHSYVYSMQILDLYVHWKYILLDKPLYTFISMVLDCFHIIWKTTALRSQKQCQLQKWAEKVSKFLMYQRSIICII